eukprot:TRINITY_DN1449_c0_g1_i2.p1 TRINITY_DN1449_c0_g1~~TRINITY_DN1449_c0_g1_i2.p1  ORF type:complete len:236 (-),score=27.91 TRINITY_DN1449_c0_g1_i2:188-895(-)
MSRKVKDLLLGTPCIRSNDPHATDIKMFPHECKEHFVELSVIMQEHYHVYKLRTYKEGSKSLLFLRNHFNSQSNVFWTSKRLNEEKQQATTAFTEGKRPNPFSKELCEYIELVVAGGIIDFVRSLSPENCLPELKGRLIHYIEWLHNNACEVPYVPTPTIPHHHHHLSPDIIDKQKRSPSPLFHEHNEREHTEHKILRQSNFEITISSEDIRVRSPRRGESRSPSRSRSPRGGHD